MPMPRLCGGTLLIGRPARNTSPWVAASKPVNIIKLVVLPEPDGPSIVKLAIGDVEIQILHKVSPS